MPLEAKHRVQLPILRFSARRLAECGGDVGFYAEHRPYRARMVKEWNSFCLAPSVMETMTAVSDVTPAGTAHASSPVLESVMSLGPLSNSNVTSLFFDLTSIWYV